MFQSELLSLLMLLWDPNWTLVLYIDLALQLSCSAFTVGVVEEERGPPMVSATPESPTVIASTPESPAIKASTPESYAVMVSIESGGLRGSLTIDCTPCYSDGHSMCLGHVHFSVSHKAEAPDSVLFEASAIVPELSVCPAMVKEATDELSVSPSVHEFLACPVTTTVVALNFLPALI